MGEIGDKKMFLDSAFIGTEGETIFSLSQKCNNIGRDAKSTLFSRGRKTESFFTEDSKLYITPKEQILLGQGKKIRADIYGFDGLSSRIVADYRHFRPSERDFLYRKLVSRVSKIQENIASLPRNISRELSLVKLWNLSIVTAVIVGMISMTFIYRYLGMGAAAVGDTNKIVANEPVTEVTEVLGAEDIKGNEEIVKNIQKIMDDLDKSKKEEFEAKIRKMVKGYPIEKMVPYILEKDQTVAAFLVGIAKKESGWGEHVPVLNGEDCFNYWGYRGIRDKMGTGGHTCFNSRKDAVDTVAKRLKTLIEDKKLDTPAEMVIWKCGSACSKDNQVAVRKWISDVDLYFQKLR